MLAVSCYGCMAVEDSDGVGPGCAGAQLKGLAVSDSVVLLSDRRQGLIWTHKKLWCPWLLMCSSLVAVSKMCMYVHVIVEGGTRCQASSVASTLEDLLWAHAYQVEVSCENLGWCLELSNHRCLDWLLVWFPGSGGGRWEEGMYLYVEDQAARVCELKYLWGKS